MSEAKKTCQLDGCKRAASTLCFCCKKNVCTRHFTEHIDAVKAQIDPLANEINSMVEKIQGLTIEQITETYFAELQQWKIDMHQLIDEIFLVKIKEVEDLIELNKNKFVEHKKQQSETIMKIQDEVKQLVEDGDATFEQIQLLKNQLATVETNLTSFRKDFLSVNARVFAQGLITVSSNLNKPSLPPPQTSSKFLSLVLFLNKTRCDFNQNRIRQLHRLVLVLEQRQLHSLFPFLEQQQLHSLFPVLEQRQPHLSVPTWQH
jgi:hypothetical protein